MPSSADSEKEEEEAAGALLNYNVGRLVGSIGLAGSKEGRAVSGSLSLREIK